MSKRKKKAADEAPAFPSRPAAEGAAISVIVNDEERTLEAVETADGWAITPGDAAEARALERFADEAFMPTPAGPAPTPEPAPQAEYTPAEAENGQEE